MSFVSSMNPIYHNHNFVLCDEVIGPLHINLILLDFSLICTIFIVFISPFVVLSETISFEKKTLLVICLFLICKIDMSLFATGTVGNLVFLRVMFEFAQLSILPSLVRHTWTKFSDILLEAATLSSHLYVFQGYLFMIWFCTSNFVNLG